MFGIFLSIMKWPKFDQNVLINVLVMIKLLLVDCDI